MFNMATITVNIKDEVNEEFRKTVEERLGRGKGVLGKAMEDAMQKWAREKKTEEYVEEALALMKKGLYKVGKNYTFKREEAYE